MKKTRNFLIGLMFLNIFAFSTIMEVQAVGYDLGVSIGESTSYMMTGSSSTMKVTLNIKTIYTDTADWNITIEVSAEMMPNFETNITLPLDPSTAVKPISFGAGPEMICPLPVAGYLAEMANALGENYSSNSTSLIRI